MSAWIVSDKHINYMVNAAIQYNRRLSGIRWGIDGPRVETENMDEVALGLINENIKSVNYRYDRHEPTPLRESFRTRPTNHIDAVQVLKAVNCYEYQACEHPEWAGSKAWKFCRSLKESAICEVPGYDDAAWGID